MAESFGDNGAREGLFAALKSTIATVLAIVRTRAELLVTEAEEEKFRVMSLWAKAIGAAFLLALGIVMAVIGTALAFWEQRVMVVAGFAVVFLGGASGWSWCSGGLPHNRARCSRPAWLNWRPIWHSCGVAVTARNESKAVGTGNTPRRLAGPD